MRLKICAVGRLRAGPERALCDDYRQRCDRTGRALGLGPLTITEVEDRKGGGIAAEAALLSNAVPKGALVCLLDERGSALSSTALADRLAHWCDAGRPEVAFLIGGADGLDPELGNSTDFALSFGSMVWPHMLARAMLTEQLYRAATILAGSPYHRS